VSGKKLGLTLLAWELLVISSLWWIPKASSGKESVLFIIWIWALFGPPLFVAARRGRVRDPSQMRRRPEIRQAALGMLVVWGAVGVVWLFIDAKNAQIFLLLAAVGAAILHARGSVDTTQAAIEQHKNHGRTTRRGVGKKT
jgi:hypothetical protein